MNVLQVFLIFTSSAQISCNSRIYFYFPEDRPDESRTVPTTTTTTTTPDCGNSSSLWCDPHNYPDSTVTQILNTNGEINKFLDQDRKLRLDVKYLSNYENICNEETEYIYPKAAKNSEGYFMFIVNSPGGSYKHRQLVKVTKCFSPEEECGQGELFSSVSTSCVQEYSDHKLLALSMTGEELVVDTFSFPSCCICKVDISIEL